MTSNPASVGPAPDGEWIEWSGGENPVPGERVEIRTRYDADRSAVGRSSTFHWQWFSDNSDYEGDIIAYRIAPHPDREAEADLLAILRRLSTEPTP